MIKEGCLKGIDEIYGIHNYPGGLEGFISVKKKAILAGIVDVYIEITGKGGHGSEPANSIDPITAGCLVHNALHTIKSRKMLNSSVASFTICKFLSGSTFNVIPEKCVMEGTIRYFDFQVRDLIME